jgi:large subunit ribosomal protein L4
MAELEIKNMTGKTVGKQALSEALTNAEVKPVSLHRVVVAEEAAGRQGTQKTKTRSEARGGGRKPYKQKKTGNARQGSIRAPHYAHGGMALALTPRDYTKKVNKKEKRAALVAALSAHIEAGNVSVVDSINFDTPKTKEATALLEALGLKDQRRVLVVLPQYDQIALKSFRNLPNVTVRTAPSNEERAKTQVFSTRDLLVAHKVVIAKDAFAKIEEAWI